MQVIAAIVECPALPNPRANVEGHILYPVLGRPYPLRCEEAAGHGLPYGRASLELALDDEQFGNHLQFFFISEEELVNGDRSFGIRSVSPQCESLVPSQGIKGSEIASICSRQTGLRQFKPSP